MKIYDRYKNLKKSEKEFVWAHPITAAIFSSNATTALYVYRPGLQENSFRSTWLVEET
ncbi:MAG: hypothetical protein GY737_28835 [Desulfobacteraceae bacterium]|nr:hypothetical protein [Desulfobacteraceae bacterium]